MLKRYAPDAGESWSKWDGLRLQQAPDPWAVWLATILFWILCIDVVLAAALLTGFGRG